MSRDICKKIGLEYFPTIDNFRAQYSKITKISIHEQPVLTQNVRGDGNCLYRAISYIVSGTEDNYAILKQKAGEELGQFGKLYNNIPTDNLPALISDAITDGSWAEDYHFIVLSAILNLPVYVFDRTYHKGNNIRPQWSTYVADVSPKHPKIKVLCNFRIYCNLVLCKCIRVYTVLL